MTALLDVAFSISVSIDNMSCDCETEKKKSIQQQKKKQEYFHSTKEETGNRCGNYQTSSRTSRLQRLPNH